MIARPHRCFPVSRSDHHVPAPCAKIRHSRIEICELRLRDRAGQVRVISYLKKGDALYLVHAFRKKTQTIPRRELDIIHKRLKEI